MSLSSWIYAAVWIAGIARAARLVKSSYGSIRRLMQCPRHRVNLQSVVQVGTLMYAVGPKYTMPVSGSHYITPDMLCFECLSALKRRIVVYEKLLGEGEYRVDVTVFGDSVGDHADISAAGLSSWELKRVQMHELALQEFVKGHRVGFTYNSRVDALEAANYSTSVDFVKELYRTISRRKGRK